MLFKITGLIFFVILLCFGIASAEFDDSSLAVSLRKQTPARRCIVPASNNGEDDSPAILAAFEKCRTNALIVFQNTTYHIGTVMKFTDLENVNIEIHGTLLWSTDIQYWLANSLPIGPGKDQESYPPAAFQNQTTAFILGGKRLYVEGFGHGTFDGNGQVWYDFVKGQSNYPRRPHAIVITAQDSYIHGLRWVQPQMWTVTIVSSKRVLLEDIYINSTSHSSQPARNTDGANTLFSDSIVFRRWEVDNGDDCIAMKANSTNILIEDAIFYRGHGVAIGSIGQYYDRFEIAENIVARNITMYGSKFATRIKTWTGEQNQWPPNGGGGGRGYARNVSYENITIYDASDESPIVINQCYSNVGLANCSTSTFDISNISWKNIRGTAKTQYVARLQCSRSHGGCDGLKMEGIDFLNVADDTGGTPTSRVRCSNVNEPEGFVCS
ncbi:polygalacturonase [Corynespora cassiicola Philippines]|uniref:Polygalacturonase n=1 Tax=Corynespora cassiicola Philippines TaxID=1448308 RepID=A0A2T2NA25_CORCC|nr:polygalacturonase [Corynespora cassiicola Philippines]